MYVTCPGDGNAGTITMSEENVILDEVSVKASRPVITLRGGTLVTPVEGTILEYEGTANDVLSHVPMILGRDGNFTVMGKGSPIIYINNRKLADYNDLWILNSSDIKNIEVITNPGVKYAVDAKAVIRIITKRPQGDGWSGMLRTHDGWQQGFFGTRDYVNLKYRSKGFEVFFNFSYINAKNHDKKTSDMITRSPSFIDQNIDTDGTAHINYFTGTAGFSYFFNERHAIGAYYSNGWTKNKLKGNYESTMSVDGILEDEICSTARKKNRNYPSHYANVYYEGTVGKLSIDLNADYLWNKNGSAQTNNENGTASGYTSTISSGRTRNRMVAEKLVLGYPVWKGKLEAGNEFTLSRSANSYTTNSSVIGNSDARVDERNIAGFIELMQQFGRVGLSTGLRYEHLKFGYSGGDDSKADQSKIYNNIYPSLSVSTGYRDFQFGLNYTYKTNRPDYAALNGTIDYINRFTLEGGNPYLLPGKTHTVELTGIWKYFYTQISYSHLKDPVMTTAFSYNGSEETKLITKDNMPDVSRLSFVAGAQLQFSIWQPTLNMSVTKQWLCTEVFGGSNLRSPIVLLQWQNSIHLPTDIWLGLDAQWTSQGHYDNILLKPTSCVNVRIYRTFVGERFRVTLEANDIFNKSGQNYTIYYGHDVILGHIDRCNNRLVRLTLQYTFNMSRDRYRGTGAGQTEKGRFE